MCDRKVLLFTLTLTRSIGCRRETVLFVNFSNRQEDQSHRGRDIQKQKTKAVIEFKGAHKDKINSSTYDYDHSQLFTDRQAVYVRIDPLDERDVEDLRDTRGQTFCKLEVPLSAQRAK